MLCLYGFFLDNNYPMHVIGHDDEFIQGGIGKMGGNF